jgi:hypothetical protein
MKRREFNRMFGAMAVAPIVGVRPGAPATGHEHAAHEADGRTRRRWSLVADVAECCSCEIPCSCNFGRPDPPCHGTRLIQVREGDLDGVDLTGLAFVVTFDMGIWTRLYLDESLSPERAATLEALLPVAFGGFQRAARSVERVPLAVTPGTETFAFEVPESRVEMRLMPGLGGEPIRITGLPNPAYHDYVQYESVVHTHSSDDGDWSHSGTNGFRSVMRVSG